MKNRRLNIRITEEQFAFIKENKLNVTEIMTTALAKKMSSVRTCTHTVRTSTDNGLEEIYSLYPRKIGKKKGMAIASRIERTEDLKKAVENYAAYCKDKDPQYIKHFSTFMSCWEDWVSPVKELKHGEIDWENFFDAKNV